GRSVLGGGPGTVDMTRRHSCPGQLLQPYISMLHATQGPFALSTLANASFPALGVPLETIQEEESAAFEYDSLNTSQTLREFPPPAADRGPHRGPQPESQPEAGQAPAAEPDQDRALCHGLLEATRLDKGLHAGNRMPFLKRIDAGTLP